MIGVLENMVFLQFSWRRGSKDSWDQGFKCLFSKDLISTIAPLLCNAVFIFPNKGKVAEFLIEFTKILLKHFYTKRIDGLKVIGINKDLIKSSTMLY